MQPPSALLAIDTATGPCSVAVFVGGVLAAQEAEPSHTRQAAQLLPMVERVMRRAGVAYEDLGRIAVSIGPGSFTGLRVGLSAARALGFARHIPVTGISTLAALAAQAKSGGAAFPLAAVLNAGKGEAYAQAFALDAQGEIHPQTPPQMIPCNRWPEAFHTCATLTGATSLLTDTPITALPLMQDAAAVGLAALHHPLLQAEPLPLYIRPPDAKTMEERMTG